MELLRHLLNEDPSRPRLTFYNESTGSRLDFSATTLDNWAAKVANMLEQEFDLQAGADIGVSLPTSWQSVAIILGALAARMNIHVDSTAVDILFCGVDAIAEDAPADTVVVTDDPFGRGVAELGLELPAGSVDFGPTVRFYGDQYIGDSPALPEVIPPAETAARVLSTSISTWPKLVSSVLSPLAAGGSAVVVVGMSDVNRLSHIADVEKVDVIL
ncbi:TIGR03089 family protein [Corynebacterium epidermidicanis]|uniref:Putative TIGR03089 family protein n=1 Tax=Corynebacterium epidermidicanis TaxID=1050174 RepID=A0A0G3GMZ4_9CORY|nr:TIGR03089 family protein [Corynebacterium epidermidicanis]AKK02519.1 putative TIGR03089 family protein [Corynebacterium epidermidicanis]